MAILSWIVIGVLAGFAARIVTGRHIGLLATVVVGVVGAIVGGWVLTMVTHGPGLTGFSLRSFVVAFVGAVALLILQGLVSGRRRHWRWH